MRTLTPDAGAFIRSAVVGLVDVSEFTCEGFLDFVRACPPDFVRDFVLDFVCDFAPFLCVGMGTSDLPVTVK
jgi:hypothetical protein